MIVPSWEYWFPRGKKVIALPGWGNARLYVEANTLRETWRGSRLYPAHHHRACLHRALLRAGALLRPRLGRTVRVYSGELAEFIEQVAPGFRPTAVLIGTPGPAQKTVVELRDRGSARVFLKHGCGKVAEKRVRHECSVLRSLPEGLGPEVVGAGCLGEGFAMLTTPVEGRPLRPASSSIGPLRHFLERLCSDEHLPVEQHPLLQDMLGHAVAEFDSLIDALADRTWPVAVQHGDVAPWNLYRVSSHELNAVDWEFASLRSFPFLDHAYWELRIGQSLRAECPARALLRTIKVLSDGRLSSLEYEEAVAVTGLAAYDFYEKARQDGHVEESPAQVWRRGVWESAIRCIGGRRRVT